jgi:hypothetical protein
MIDDYRQRIEISVYFHPMYSNFVYCQYYYQETQKKKVNFEYECEYWHQSEEKFVFKEFN